MEDRKTILAVDDMPENLTSLRTILQDYFDVRLAKTAKLALTLLDTLRVDLILLDIEMPGLSGFQFLEENRRLHPDQKKIPVIFVTSHADTKMINQAINAGAIDYVVKPIRPEILLKKIEGIIGLPERKSARNPLEYKLTNLLATMASADSARAEMEAEELTKLVETQAPYIRESIEKINQLIKHFDYEAAGRKVTECIKQLSWKTVKRNT